MKHIFKRKPTGSSAAVLFSAALLLTGCQQPQPSAAPAQSLSFPNVIQVQNQVEEPHVISVQSAETVKTVPDMAEIRFGISTREKTAKACQEKNSQDLAKVIQFLKDFGIAEESIQSSNYGMNPVYDWNSGRTITGYEMETQLTVSDIPIDQAGILISSCVEAGINNIDRVSYLSSQYDACYQEALAKAIASAREKAQVMAEAGGCTLGQIVHVEEYSASQNVRYNGYAAEKSMNTEARMADMAAAVEPGQVSIEARIMVEFSID